MKKFTKLIVLSLCSWFFFLWFSNAQDLTEENSYSDKINVISDSGHYFWGLEKREMDYNPNIYSNTHCTCGMNMLDFSVRVFLFWIKILLWIMIIILSFKTILLYKKLSGTYNHNRLFYFPVINLYPLSKITIWKIRFFILILLLWFFFYNTYSYKIFTDNNLCCENPIRQWYSWIIVWICSTIILWILISKLSYLIKSYNKIDKESPND